MSCCDSSICLCGQTQCTKCGHWDHFSDKEEKVCWMCKGHMRQRIKAADEKELFQALEEAASDLKKSRSKKVKAMMVAWEKVFSHVVKDRQTKQSFKELFSGKRKLVIRKRDK